jgi:tetratricopeptide (TPR) repeat protein
MGLWVGAALLAGCATTGQTADGGGPVTSEAQAEAMGRYLSSVVHQKLGQVPKAIEDLRAAADLAPYSERLVMQLLGAYYLNEDYENAATMAERAVANDPKSVVLHVWLGRIYYQLKRFDDATAAFGEAVALDPDNSIAYEALAQIEEDTNDLAGAVDTYKKLIEISPNSAFLYYRLGASLVQTDDPAGARTAIEKALELNPALTPARYMLGLIYMEDGEYDAAADQFTRFLKENPGHAQAQVNLAAARARQGKYDEAIEGLTRVIESAEVKTEHHLLRTALLIRRGGHIEAGQSAAPNDAPLLGSLLNALARKASGEPYLAPLERLDTVEGDLDAECNDYLNKIVSLFGKEFGEFIASEIAAVLKGGVHSKSVEIIYARTLMAVQRREEAATALKGTLERFGGDKWLHYYLATVYEDLHNLDATEEQLRAALKFDPNDADILNFLGYHLADKDKDIPQAKELIERALQIDPDNGFYLDSLGWVYYRMGRGDEAVDYIRRAIRAMNTDDAVLRDHLGDAYLLADDTAAAIKEWQRALRLDPKIKGVEEKIRKHQPRVSE